MKKVLFKNKPNERIQVKFTENGNEHNIDYFISRSIAVSGFIFSKLNNEIYILSTKRSSNMIDEPNKMCVPCGYLDWNETIYDSLIREVFEETSLYLPFYNENILFNNDDKPFRINDNPNSNRQNVTFSFINVLNFNIDNFPFYIESYVDEETDMIKWINIKDIDQYEWAFNHNNIIKLALDHYNNQKNHS